MQGYKINVSELRSRSPWETMRLRFWPLILKSLGSQDLHWFRGIDATEIGRVQWWKMEESNRGQAKLYFRCRHLLFSSLSQKPNLGGHEVAVGMRGWQRWMAFRGTMDVQAVAKDCQWILHLLSMGRCGSCMSKCPGVAWNPFLQDSLRGTFWLTAKQHWWNLQIIFAEMWQWLQWSPSVKWIRERYLPEAQC